jgi:hypothetical protein
MKGISMRKSTKITLAAVAACLIAAGTTALTEANVVPSGIAGYGTNVVSGVTATNIAYNVDNVTPNASLLKSIVFTENEDVTSGHTALLTINGPTSTAITCNVSVANTITCLTTHAIATITSIGLTVTHN